MTVALLKKEVIAAITPLYGKREASNIATLLIEKRTGIDKFTQVLNKHTVVENYDSSDDVARLIKGEPIQYVLEEAWFYGNVFVVSRDTLIPRPETEELVDWVIKDNDQFRSQSILDIGTGTGCIPISLKIKLPNTTISGVDISEAALRIAKQNSVQLRANVSFIQMNFLDEANWPNLPQIDILTSNPPYIAEFEKDTMHQNVLNYEPHTALFVPNADPLLFYKAIKKFADGYLKKSALIYLELNELLGKETAQLFSSEGYCVDLKKDMQGKDRMLKVLKLS